MSEGELYTISGDILQSDANVVIGAYVNTLRDFEYYNLFSGELDDLKIYKTALSTSEITEIYENYLQENSLQDILGVLETTNISSTLAHAFKTPFPK